MKKNKAKYSLMGIISIFVLIYLVIVIVGNITKRNIETYTIQYSKINTDLHAEAFIVRDETIIKSKGDGNIVFFANNLGKIVKDDIIYVIDTSGTFYDQLKSISKDSVDTGISKKEISNDINTFVSNQQFTNLIKTNALAQNIQDIYFNRISKPDLEKYIEDFNNKNKSLTSYKSESTGIFVNSVDGYENLTVDRLTENMSNIRKLNTNTVLNNNVVKKDDPIGKIINSEQWNIVFEVSENEYQSLADKKYINVHFSIDNSELLGALELVKNNGKCYAKVTLDQGVIRYANLRTINISLPKPKLNGYMIPKSALGKNNNVDGVFVTNTGIANFVPVTIIGEEENNYIIQLSEDLKPYDNIALNAKKIKDKERIYN